MNIEPGVLENAVVRLEPLAEHHRERLRPLAEESEIWALTTVRGDGPHFDAWFDLMLAGQARHEQISHCVIDKASGDAAGHSAVLSIAPQHRRLEIGWTWYGAGFRGSKINPACKHLLLGRAFACGAVRVELKTHGRNQRSQNAMLKMGAKKEGVLRRHTRCWTGEWRDTVFFSVLEEEWPSVRDRLAARLD